MSTAARPLQPHELPDLHAANPCPRTRAMLWLGLCTGLRVGEIVRLTRAHVVDDRGHLRLEIMLDTTVVIKRSRARSVPVNPLLRIALNQYLITTGIYPLHAPLFTSRKGVLEPLTPRHAMRIITDAFKAANIPPPVSSHTLRKTFANTIHNTCGKDLAVTQRALAHASPATTIAYLESHDPVIRHAISNLYLAEFTPELTLNAGG